jgi:hypothetical protein
MKKILSMGNVHQEENAETHQVKPIPVFTLELVNNLQSKNPEKNVDLQFGQSPADYESIFKKDLSFTNEEEMDAARNFLSEIIRLDDMDREYAIINSPFTNTFMILINGGESQYYKFPSLKSYKYMLDILMWITQQETYF